MQKLNRNYCCKITKYDSLNPDDKDIIGSLLKLPAKSLESKVKQLEHEIGTRKHLNNKALSTLGTRLIRLNDQLWLMRYLSVSNPGFAAKGNCESQITRLEELKTSENMNCFKDLLELTDKLQNTLDDLEIEKQKLSLLESNNNNNE